MQRTNTLLGDLLDRHRSNFTCISRFVTTESRGFKDFKYDIDYHLVTTKQKQKASNTRCKFSKSREVKYSYSSDKFHFDLFYFQTIIIIQCLFPLLRPNLCKIVTIPSNFCLLAASRSNWVESITIQNVWQFSPPGTFLFGHLGLFRGVKITCVTWSIIYANYQNTR